MRIAIAGNGCLGLSLMQPLLDSTHEVVAVVQDGRVMRGWKRSLFTLTTNTFAFENTPSGLAVRRRIPTFWIDKMDERELEPLRRLQPDILLVGGFSVILKKPILQLPRIACVNAHTSLLPRHRGPNPFSAVILQGETQSGLTFHLIDEGIDTGAILAQYPFPVGPTDTAYSVYGHGCNVARDHVVEVMDRIERQGPRATPQDEAQALYDQKLKREEYRIDWEKPALESDRLMRASRPFFTPWFNWRGSVVYLVRCQFKQEQVDAAPGTVLSVQPRLKIAVADGTCSVLTAFTKAPLPWVWPASWHGVKPGDTLSNDC